MTTTIGISVHEGVGTYHSAAEATQMARLVVAGNILWILIVNITKASILTQYLRIFCSTHARALCYLLLFSLVPAACYSIFAGIFLCRPTGKLWRPELQGSCRSAQTYVSNNGLPVSLERVRMARKHWLTSNLSPGSGSPSQAWTLVLTSSSFCSRYQRCFVCVYRHGAKSAWCSSSR